MTKDNTSELLEHLLQHHKGKHNAITQTKLADKMQMNPSTLRSELRRLREEREIPLGNQREGYYIIQDRDELQEYVAHINQEIESKRNTIKHTLEAFESFDADSITTQEEPEENTVHTPTYTCDSCGQTVAKDIARHPKQGDHEGKPLCKGCYGRVIINR